MLHFHSLSCHFLVETDFISFPVNIMPAGRHTKIIIIKGHKTKMTTPAEIHTYRRTFVSLVILKRKQYLNKKCLPKGLKFKENIRWLASKEKIVNNERLEEKNREQHRQKNSWDVHFIGHLEEKTIFEQKYLPKGLKFNKNIQRLASKETIVYNKGLKNKNREQQRRKNSLAKSSYFSNLKISETSIPSK